MSPGPGSVTFRRGALRRGAAWLAIAVGWASTAAIAIWAVGSLFAGGFRPANVVTALLLLVFGAATAGNALLLQRYCRNWGSNWLVIDETGLHGRLASSAFDVAWKEILAIRHSCRYPEGYRVSTARGDLSFTVLDLPRPKRIARAVAKKSGLEIQ